MSEQSDFGGQDFGGFDGSGGYVYDGGVTYEDPGAGYGQEQEPQFDQEAFGAQFPTAEQDEATGREAATLVAEFPRLGEDHQLADAVVQAARQIASDAGIPPQAAMRASFIREVVRAHFLPEATRPTSQQEQEARLERLRAITRGGLVNGQPAPLSQRQFWLGG